MKLLILIGISTFACVTVSCKKEQDNGFRDFFTCKVDGKKTSLSSCESFLTGGTGGGEFSCEVIGDSILFLKVGCNTKCGFYLKQTIPNGTYQLNDKNQAWFGNYTAMYRTTDINKGTLTIKKSTFQSVGLIKTIEGKFSFNAVDTSTGRIVRITDGEFLMERYDR